MDHNNQTGVKPIFIILVDISGYTNFIRLHKISLLHAEKIIGELMECMLEEVRLPVVAHEILGDAMSLYAIDDGSPGLADDIYRQLEKYFLAFRAREAYLLRECGYCTCDACNTVGQLKLKAILHSGEAAFTKIQNIQKISGVDVITAHRLLKNSIQSNEYIFMTYNFSIKCQSLNRNGFEKNVEKYDDIDPVHGLVKIFEPVEQTPETVSGWNKFKFLMKLEQYTISRFFTKSKLQFNNLPAD